MPEDKLIYYHGTITKGISELRADPVLYLTANRAYALFYIIDKDINWVTCGVKDDGVVHYDERYPNQLERLYGGKSGFLYSVRDGNFTHGKSRDIYVSDTPVAVTACEFIPDVYAEILRYEASGLIAVKRYETLSADERHAVFVMMVKYIFKNNLLTLIGPKVDFIKTSFPEAWEYAKKMFKDGVTPEDIDFIQNKEGTLQ
jgi:hypothetical protein